MKRSRGKRGQTMTEMIIIVAILAIGSILIIGLFGRQIKDVFTRMGSGLHGKTSAHDTSIDSDMEAETDVREGMDKFDEDVGEE